MEKLERYSLVHPNEFSSRPEITPTLYRRGHLYLVRHGTRGETENVNDLIDDTPMNQEGFQQSEQYARSQIQRLSLITDIPYIIQVHYGDRLRHRQTAEVFETMFDMAIRHGGLEGATLSASHGQYKPYLRGENTLGILLEENIPRDIVYPVWVRSDDDDGLSDGLTAEDHKLMKELQELGYDMPQDVLDSSLEIGLRTPYMIASDLKSEVNNFWNEIISDPQGSTIFRYDVTSETTIGAAGKLVLGYSHMTDQDIDQVNYVEDFQFEVGGKRSDTIRFGFREKFFACTASVWDTF